MNSTLVILRRAIVLALLVLLVYEVQHYRKHSKSALAEELDRLVSPSRIELQMQLLASNPHRAGSAENRKVGDAILDRLNKIGGLSVSTSEFEVALPEPVEAHLTLSVPGQPPAELDVHERVLPQDPYSRYAAIDIPYYAFTPDSDTEAEVIYANRGEKSDYQELRKAGVEPKGKIAISRLTGCCRGMKNQIAGEQGLAGLLLYPELKDQGVFKKPYPDGPFINPWTLLRGSMLRFFNEPGDPADSDSPSNLFPTVPGLPISGENAAKILGALGGTSLTNWGGLMPGVPYNTGPGPARLRMVTRSRRIPGKLRNIYAVLKGKNPDEPAVFITAHYDAWVYGASDPVSGSAVVLETADVLSRLAKSGWQPQRNIVFVFWDGEEFGMLGSSKYMRQHWSEVRNGVAAFLYVDSIRGKLITLNSTRGLEEVIDSMYGQVWDPASGLPMAELHAQTTVPGFSGDTSPFLGYAGVPVVQFNAGIYYAQYHSVYDNLFLMNHYVDPGYSYSALVTKMMTLFAVRLSQRGFLPYQFSNMGMDAKMMNQLKKHPGAGSAAASLENEVEHFLIQAQRIDRANRGATDSSDANASAVNHLLLSAVVSFTDPQEKEFLERNLMVGPNPENPCEGVDLAPLRRALASGDTSRLIAEIDRLKESYIRATGLLKQAEPLMCPKS